MVKNGQKPPNMVQNGQNHQKQSKTVKNNPKFLHFYIPTSINSNIPTFLHSYNPTFIHSLIPTFLPSYIPTFIHSYIPTFLYSYIPTFLYSFIPTFLHSYIPTSYFNIFLVGFKPGYKLVFVCKVEDHVLGLFLIQLHLLLLCPLLYFV